MTLMRIRLCFERNLIKKCEQCWMLVNTEKCKIVQDLEYIIKKRFFVDQDNFVLNLYLEDFLLPSQERIEIIHNDDLISVKEEHLKTDKITTKSNSKKRKHDQCLENVDQKSKKLKHTPPRKTNVKKKEEQNSRTWRAKNSSSKTKCQKASEFLNKLSQDVTKIFSANKTVVNNEQKQETSTGRSSDKSASKTTLKNPVTADKEVKFGNAKQKITIKHIKPRTPNTKDLKNNVGYKTNTSSSDSDESDSSDGMEDIPPVKQPITKSKSPAQINMNNTKPSLPLQKHQQMNGCVPPLKQGNNHIRFDDIDDDQSTPRPQLLPPPNILQSRNQTTIPPQATKIMLQDISPHLSPIHHTTKNINTSPNLNKNGDRTNRKVQSRKDVYMNRSQVLESTRLDKSLDKELVEKKDDVEDFTKYPLLNGPPRVGEMVAYKVIEISQSYTPEISNYKKGKVLSFNTNTNSFTIKLTKESLSRVKGDGHVSTKFELNEEETNKEQQVDEVVDEVEIPWNTMLQPRLLTHPVIT